MPLHYGNTESKVRRLDKLTARLTYCTWLWSETISKERRLSRKALSPHEKEIQEQTKLSAGFVQQCKDKAIWSWKSYKEQHRTWKWMLKRAEKRKHTKKGDKWYNKLLKREPQEPFTSPRSRQQKCPVRIDARTGRIEHANIELSSYVVRISTLVKRLPMTLLLNPSQYHKEQLEKGDIRDFEIVKRKHKYYCNITVSYEIPAQPITSIQGVDLGIVRPIATVSMSPKPSNFQLVKDRAKYTHVKTLTDRVSHLRRLGKWNVLKKLRNKRQNVSKDYDWKMTKSFVEDHCRNALVVVGNPDYIRYNHYKGNGDRVSRKLLKNWAFGRISSNILHYCAHCVGS
ncbi:MAG: hypothetical protein L6243_01990 [Candidatus Altiarchaeales archaeon]|nr:hypothetical protein [Candidatus Altiarchaeales archaeon]